MCLVLLFLFVTICTVYSRRDGSMPVCGFPNPFSEEGVSRCYSYLKIPYMCDPMGQISITEAEEIDNFVKFRYSSCANCLSQPNKCRSQNSSISRLSDINIGMAFIRQGVSELATESLYLACLQHSDLDVFDHMDTINVSPETVGKLYASILRNSWSYDNCQTDVLLLFVESWLGHKVKTNGELSDLSNLKRSVFYAFSKRLQLLLKANGKLDSVYAYIRWETPHSRSLSHKTISFLRYLRKTLSHPHIKSSSEVASDRDKWISPKVFQAKLRQKVSQWPNWAIITAAVCGGIIVICTALGLIIKTPTYSNRKTQVTSKIKAAHMDPFKGVLGPGHNQSSKGTSISLLVGKKFKGGSTRSAGKVSSIRTLFAASNAYIEGVILGPNAAMIKFQAYTEEGSWEFIYSTQIKRAYSGVIRSPMAG